MPDKNPYAIIKTQIGKSTWVTQEKVISDSNIDHILKYDRNGKLKEEIKIFRDLDGLVTDSVHAFYDEQKNIIRYYSSENQTGYHLKYDSLNTQIKATIISASDTLIQRSTPNYIQITDSSKVYSINSNSSQYQTKSHVIWNSRKQPIFYETKYKSKGMIVRTETLRWKIDQHGNTIEFSKQVNADIVKRTNYIFKDGLEIERIEKHYNPNYKVITKYNTEFW